MQSSQTRPSQTSRSGPVLALACVTALAGLVCYALASGERVYITTGDSYPGAVTAVAEPVGYFIAASAGGSAAIGDAVLASQMSRAWIAVALAAVTVAV